MGDIGAGGITAACAILIALLGRKTGGHGQYIDIGMLDGLVFWQGILGMNCLATGHGAKAGESFVLGEAACYNIYKTADHKYLALAVYEDKFWSNFCHCLGKQDWIPLQFCDSQHMEVLISDLQDIFQTRSQQEAYNYFSTARFVYGLAYQNFKENELVVTITNPEIGESKEDTVIEFKGEPIEVAFNVKYFIEIFTHN